ncbi:MAG: indole-3-glycerol-phosphate synthase [Dehalococcoidia bacterium]|nr:indole-3-glycerol-phosphate synthase [Dehalococcoidia bacterium]
MKKCQEGQYFSAIARQNARGKVTVIPDIKCVSPKVGPLLRDRDPATVARQFISYGATALSVVTETEHFGGSLALLRTVSKSVDVPILCKDFITDVEMLAETKKNGASAVLLICAINQTDNLLTLCEKALSLGLETVVEVHSKEEMLLARSLSTRIIGINNRNIKELEKDGGGPQMTASLAPYAPQGVLLISESGITSPADVRTAVKAKANAVLVGTYLWQADNIELAYKSLCIERNNENETEN